MHNNIVIENDFLKMEILPERGGKITSLYNKKNQSEWLYQQVSDPENKTIPGTFGKNDAFGFDEMFPTINAESWGNDPDELVELPDHGEIWSKKWSVIHKNDTSLQMEVKGELFSYVFERKIELCSNEIHIHYSIENLSSDSIPSLWTPHPLFSFTKETEILVPESMKNIRQASDGGILGEYNTIHPLKNQKLFRPGELPDGTCYKFYNEDPLQTGYCGLKDQRGILEMMFSENSVPWLGFWINNGLYGQYNLALEPATAPMDSPGAAERMGIKASMNSFEIKDWFLKIKIT